MLEILLFSFLVALTGALSPGPLLTFTIYKSIKEKRGYLVGVFVILGHATLEFLFILLLLAGVYLFFQNIIVLTVIGLVGGFLLVIFGILVIRDTYKKSVQLNVQTIEPQDYKGYKGNTFLGGIFVSLSNPFWTFWWAVIGLGLMINLNITLQDPFGIFLFFIGHEAGDSIFYIPLSIFVALGGKSLNPKIYKYILIGCGIFMIVFGIYLATNILFFPPELE